MVPSHFRTPSKLWLLEPYRPIFTTVILVPHGNLSELLPAAMLRSSAAEPLRKEGIPGFPN